MCKPDSATPSSVEYATHDDDRCPATIVELDDRWGGFTDRCDLREGHDGDHRSRRTACRPAAYLAWNDDGVI